MNAVGPENTVKISAEQIDGRAQIIFSQLDRLSVMPADAFPGEQMEALLSALEGDITVDAQAGTISILLPILT
jgi:hypothetical protein